MSGSEDWACTFVFAINEATGPKVLNPGRRDFVGTVAFFHLETMVDPSGQAQNDPLGFVPGGFFFGLSAGDSAGEGAFRNRKRGWQRYRTHCFLFW